MAVSRYRLIVFDWDGTLSDSCGVIVDHLQKAARETGLDAFDEASARRLIGLSKPELLLKLYPNLDNRHLSDMLEKYRYYHAKHSDQLQLFPHVVSMLDQCLADNHLLAIATGCSRYALDYSLKETDLESYFCHVRTADDCYSKPHPQMLEELMTDCDVLPEETLMLGDNLCDIQMAQSASVSSIGVDFGSGLSQQLLDEGALSILKDWRQLSKFK